MHFSTQNGTDSVKLTVCEQVKKTSGFYKFLGNIMTLQNVKI
jgi:hypothetical protein